MPLLPTACGALFLFAFRRKDMNALVYIWLGRVWKPERAVLFQQDKDRCNVNEAEESLRQFIVASGNPPELFDFLPKALNQMTFLIKPPITLALNLIGNATWDIGDCADTYQPINKRLAVISSISIYIASLQVKSTQ